MWKNYILLFLLCFFAFSLSLQSEVTLTDQEFNELMTLQIQQKETLIRQNKTIENLENELTAAKTLQEALNETIRTLYQLIDALKKSLSALRTGNPISLELGSTYNTEDGLGGYAGISIELP